MFIVCVCYKLLKRYLITLSLQYVKKPNFLNYYQAYLRKQIKSLHSELVLYIFQWAAMAVQCATIFYIRLSCDKFNNSQNHLKTVVAWGHHRKKE